MTAEGDKILPIDDRDLINLRIQIEVLSRADKAPDLGTQLGAFMGLAEPYLADSETAVLVGMDEGQMYQLMTEETPIPVESEAVIHDLYTIGALIWQECAGIEKFDSRLRTARAKLTKPLSTLRVDPEEPSSPDRSILQAIKDGNMKTVLLLANMQLESQEITALSD